MKLTPTQLHFFHTFGYLAFPALFSSREAAWIAEEFDTAIQTFGGGKEHDGSKRTMMGAPIERTKRLCTLLDDERVTGIIGGVLGDDFNYCSGDGNYYTGDTGWHPDGNWGKLVGLKVAFYLDPVRRDSGCLRVIPGSQKPTHFVRAEKIDPNKAQELFGLPARDFPGNVPLETNPGDVVMFNHDLFHAAFGGSTRRRMFTMNCTARAKTQAERDTLRDYLRIHSAGGYNVNMGAGMYCPAMVDTADARRRVHLEQAAEIHDELFPHLKRGVAPAVVTSV